MTDEVKPKGKTGPKGPRTPPDKVKIHKDVLIPKDQVERIEQIVGDKRGAFGKWLAEAAEEKLARHDRAEKRKREKKP